MNVKDEETGEVTNWGAEMGPPHGLQRNGWRRETLKIGEWSASRLHGQERDKRMNASTVTLASTGGRPGQTLDAVQQPERHCRSTSGLARCPARSQLLRQWCCASPRWEGTARSAGRSGGVERAARRASAIQRREPEGKGPAPRANGRILLVGPLLRRRVSGRRASASSIPSSISEQVPFQPWARALYVNRQDNELEPHTRCKASGVARQFLTPYGVEFLEMGVPHLHLRRGRSAHVPHHLHGRPHASQEPRTELLRPLHRLVGRRYARRRLRRFNENSGSTGEGCHTPSRCARWSASRASAIPGMKYEVTVDDPGAYTAPWTGWFF